MNIYIYIYIYTYCHPQTDCFVLSELFSVTRDAERSKPGSKSVQLYVRLSSRPLGHQAEGCPRGVMVKAMHCGIVVREFVLQSRYYVHFRANTLGKGMNPLILPPAMGK